MRPINEDYNRKLLEKYEPRIKVANDVSKSVNGVELKDYQRLALATTLNTTSNFLNEKFSNSVGTQRADMGEFKKFCMNVNTVTLANLIFGEVAVEIGMPSTTGYITFMQYVAGSNKGGVKQGDVFNDPMYLGKMSEERTNYTGAPVVENVGEEDTEFVPAWTPVVGNKVIGIKKDGSGEVEIELVDGKATFVANTYSKIKYSYDNVTIPQNDLPILNARTRGVALLAKERNLAVYYSNLAQFQAKTEMGMDLGASLAQQAIHEISLGIDNEGIQLYKDEAFDSGKTWNQRVPYGISLRDHAVSFVKFLTDLSKVIRKKTQKFDANFVILSNDAETYLSVIDAYKPSEGSKKSGAYFAGKVKNLSIYVSPLLEDDEVIAGYNSGNLLEATPAVLGIYMPISPTQMIQTPDGGIAQGFQTLYDIKMLNPDLLVKGRIVDEDYEVVTKASN